MRGYQPTTVSALILALENRIITHIGAQFNVFIDFFLLFLSLPSLPSFFFLLPPASRNITMGVGNNLIWTKLLKEQKHTLTSTKYATKTNQIIIKNILPFGQASFYAGILISILWICSDPLQRAKMIPYIGDDFNGNRFVLFFFINSCVFAYVQSSNLLFVGEEICRQNWMRYNEKEISSSYLLERNGR